MTLRGVVHLLGLVLMIMPLRKQESEENLMKLNLSKAKELIIKRRTTLSPPDPIVNVNRVLYLKLKLSGVTFQESTTSWDKHFGDLSSKTYAHP